MPHPNKTQFIPVGIGPPKLAVMLADQMNNRMKQEEEGIGGN